MQVAIQVNVMHYSSVCQSLSLTSVSIFTHIVLVVHASSFFFGSISFFLALFQLAQMLPCSHFSIAVISVSVC